MDPQTLIGNLVGSLAWPMSVLAIVLVLRNEIRGLIPHLKKLKAGPVEAEFDRDVAKLNALARSVESFGSPMRVAAVPIGPSEKAAQISPRAAVIEAWLGVECAARQLLAERGLLKDGPNPRSPLEVSQALLRSELMGSQELGMFENLRYLRNLAVHSGEFEPSPESVVGYVKLATMIQDSIERRFGKKEH